MATYVIPSAAIELLDNLEIEAETEQQAIEIAIENFKGSMAAFGLVKDQTEEDIKIETCSKCKREFREDEHFVMCPEEDCPERAISLIDMILGEDHDDK